MSFALSPHLWTPQRRGCELTIAALTRGKRVCLYSPTGGGKTAQAIELLRWADSQGVGGCFYVNRKLLVSQTAKRFKSAGLKYGVRAADYETEFDYGAPFQICSADTERSRVFGPKKYWELHDVGPGGLVVVDEAHIQKSDTIRMILDEYEQRQARIVLLTATPIGLSKWADELVVSGTMAEYRACKALVPAVVKSPDQPDLRKVKRGVTGEFIQDGEARKIYTQSIVDNVLKCWEEFNPDARPTLLYAPGVKESRWFCEKFRAELGVNFCHVDATDANIDGKDVKLTRAVWEEISERYQNGEIKGICSRMKLREGVDFPGTYHAILATPIGSLASYIQTCGRVLRHSKETPDQVLITDHGGNYHRHGSPNADRDWQGVWDIPEGAVSEMLANDIKDGKSEEPIRCPKCHSERLRGNKCPQCGFEHSKSHRNVIMENGTLVEVEGKLIKPRRIKLMPDTSALWERLYWGYRKKKVDATFNQMAAFFHHTHGYSPPRDLPFMPKDSLGWYSKVHTVEMSRLNRSPQNANA